MTYSVDMYMNANYSNHGIFEKTVTLGESWLKDKWRTNFLGSVENNKVFRYSDYYDEDKNEVIETKELIKECADEKEAIEFAKEYFAVTNVITN